jgi:nicotinate-nucleotide pyrophosphorylase (carboxylating)
MHYNEPISEQQLHDFIVAALHEDVRDGDHTCLACVPPDKRDHAVLKVKQNGILAGIEIAKAVFRHVDSTSIVKILKHDGDAVQFGDIALEVECTTHALLKAERLILNTMQRMSGIATATRHYVDAISDLPVQLLDTRKTTPLLRFLEKYAVRIGGGTNYRYGLYDRIMIKDNHADACGGLTIAISRTLNYLKTNNLDLGITVEVRNIAELQTVLDTGAQLQVMLDNFKIEDMREAVRIVDNRLPTEASGGVTLTTLRQIAETGVDFISVGALTHSAGCLDLSLKVVKK